MSFVRSIGRWALTGLVINCMIGSGIFGIPGELNRLLGRASPVAMVLAALATALVILPTMEVASQFSEPGGAYLYARTAFGRFAGLQVGWFSLLSMVAADAANASLFVIYLAGFFPAAGQSWPRNLLMAALIAIPAWVNYRGANSGASLSSLLVVAKLLPLAVLIVLGLLRFGHNIPAVHVDDVAALRPSVWLSALLLTGFSYGGFEAALCPAGEVKDPKRTVPFSLAAALISVACVYALVQVVTLATIGASTSARPVADVAAVLLGGWGAPLIAVAVMISTSGHISSMILHAPRLAYSLAAKGEFPAFLAQLHPRYHTPGTAIGCYALLVWVFAASGGFLWALLLASGAKMIIYAAICAGLIRLRRMRPQAEAWRVPFGTAFGVAGTAISLAIVAQISKSGALLMLATAVVAAVNWWLTRGRVRGPEVIAQESAAGALAP